MSTENPILRNINTFFNTLDHKIEKPVRNHLKDVYSALSMCLLAAGAGAYVHVFTDLLRGNFLCSIGAIVLMLLLYSTPDNGSNRILRLGYFLGFGGLTGLGTGPILDYAMAVNPQLIVTAFMAIGRTFSRGTSNIFDPKCSPGIGHCGLTQKQNPLPAGHVRGVRMLHGRGALLAPDRKFLYTLFWLSLANLFFQVSAIFTAQLYIGLAVMSAFVLYDTQLIMEKRRQGDTDYIWHAVDLFVDFMDIFRRLLIILSQKVRFFVTDCEREQSKKRRD